MNAINLILGGVVGVLVLKKFSAKNAEEQAALQAEEAAKQAAEEAAKQAAEEAAKKAEEAAAELKKKQTDTEAVSIINIIENNLLKVYATYRDFEVRDGGVSFVRRGTLFFENKTDKPLLISHLIMHPDGYQTSQLGQVLKTDSPSDLYNLCRMSVTYKWNNKNIALFVADVFNQSVNSDFGVLVPVASSSSIAFEVALDTWKPETNPLVLTADFAKNPFSALIDYRFQLNNHPDVISGVFEFPF